MPSEVQMRWALVGPVSPLPVAVACPVNRWGDHPAAAETAALAGIQRPGAHNILTVSLLLG